MLASTARRTIAAITDLITAAFRAACPGIICTSLRHTSGTTRRTIRLAIYTISHTGCTIARIAAIAPDAAATSGTYRFSIIGFRTGIPICTTIRYTIVFAYIPIYMLIRSTGFTAASVTNQI